jgi:hypothetical protein
VALRGEEFDELLADVFGFHGESADGGLHDACRCAKQ